MSGRETASSRRALPGSACVFPIADTLLPALFFNPLGRGGGSWSPLVAYSSPFAWKIPSLLGLLNGKIWIWHWCGPA